MPTAGGPWASGFRGALRVDGLSPTVPGTRPAPPSQNRPQAKAETIALRAPDIKENNPVIGLCSYEAPCSATALLQQGVLDAPFPACRRFHALSRTALMPYRPDAADDAQVTATPAAGGLYPKAGMRAGRDA
jgi:hypothetical protein